MEKFYAIIGNPIAHSLSPEMHNKLFNHYKIAANYERILVKEAELAQKIEQLKARNIAGFNVTIPHKRTIINLLDDVDPLALAIGAVNTVVNEGGKLIGYNTDGLGYLYGLEQIDPDLLEKQVLIIGAGGASRAIFFTLADQGLKNLHIANRTVEKANELISSCPYKINAKAISLQTAEKRLTNYDIIIQTTSIGMAPQINETPLIIKELKDNAIVSDIIYNPKKTRFLLEAERAGAIIQNGIPMFIYQGALAFKKWTNLFPDVKLMETTVLKHLPM